jgi:hypothetical protein
MEADREKIRREGRSFGLAFGGILALAGGWWLWRGRFLAVAPWTLGLGALLVVLALAAPRVLLVPSRLWLRFGEALSFATTRLVLALVFYLVLTPLGLVRRALGGDPLGRKAAGAGSYWRPYPSRQRDRRHYQKMY